MSGYSWLLAAGMVGTAAVGAATAAPKKAPSQAAERYLEYARVLERAASIDDLLPFMTAEDAERTKTASAAAREHAWTVLRDPAWRLTEMKVASASERGDHASLTVTAKAPGSGRARQGFVDMVREGGEWKVQVEVWPRTDVDPRRSSPGVQNRDIEIAQETAEAAKETAPAAAARPAERGLDDAKTSAALSEMYEILSAESAYTSLNGGYYDTLACLARVGGCMPKAGSVTYSWLKPELSSLATRGGYKRRFDPGPSAPAGDVKSKGVSPSSVSTYAYWIIPDPPEPGRRARCGDASGDVCEMPDGTAPPTKGECPLDRGCRPID